MSNSPITIQILPPATPKIKEVGLQSLSLLKELLMEKDKVYDPLLLVVLLAVELFLILPRVVGFLFHDEQVVKH
jgi:hypothetical protein